MEKIQVTLEGRSPITLSLPQGFTDLLLSYCKDRKISLQQGLQIIFVSLGEFLVMTLESGLQRCIFCEDCGIHGHTNLPELPGQQVLCGECLSKRKENDAKNKFLRSVRGRPAAN